MLNKYTALYAAYVLQNGMPEDALQLFVKHGAPPTSNNLNLYRRLVVDLLSEPSPKSYRVWADLREVMLRCVVRWWGEDIGRVARRYEDGDEWGSTSSPTALISPT